MIEPPTPPFLTDAGEPRALVVISSMRSGSNLLIGYLRQAPKAAFFGEILRIDYPDMAAYDWLANRLGLPESARALHGESAAAFWDLVLARTLARKRHAGAKLLGDHRRGEDIWERISEPDHRIIHLWRDSTFDTWVSLQLALVDGVWKGHERRAVDHPRVPFDPAAYERYRDRIAAHVAVTRARYGHLPRYVEVEYTELTDIEAMTDLMERLFGERIAPESRLQQQHPLPKVAYLLNPEAAAPYVDDSLRSGFHRDRVAQARRTERGAQAPR